MRRVAIVTDDPGWHGARLVEAFLARGVDTRYVSLVDCRVDLAAPTAGLVIPGFEERLPDGVFVRGVPGGTLEQVVMRLDVLHALREIGVPVCNDGRAIERTVDKAMTTWLLAREGIPTPETWVCESTAAARAVLSTVFGGGGRVVLKPLFGSQGEGLSLLARQDDLPTPDALAGVYYLQRFIEGEAGEARDWRLFVAGGEVVAGMMRRSAHWVTNRAQGGRCEPVELDPQMIRLALDAARAVRIGYAGVDLLREPGGRFLVSEVNSVPAWLGLQSVTPIDIAGRLADHMLSMMEPGQPRIAALSA